MKLLVKRLGLILIGLSTTTTGSTIETEIGDYNVIIPIIMELIGKLLGIGLIFLISFGFILIPLLLSKICSKLNKN